MDGITTVEKPGYMETSGELGAIFECVADATVGDVAKFTPAICRRMAREIVCRTYAGAIHELCHLVHMADSAFGQAGYEALFWGGGPARASEFRRCFANAAAAANGRRSDLRLSATQVRIAYGDGEFAIAYSRMPLLSALMEFLVSALGYETLDGVLRCPPDRRPGRTSASQAANAISRELYAFLKLHLAPVQAQRKFHLLMSFLSRRHGNRAIGPEQIDDQAVLDFWIYASANPDGELDFRKFETVFRDAVRLRDSLAAARDRAQLRSTLPLGQDRAAGEVDPADVGAAVDHVEARQAPLEVLRSPPANAIKFLNKRETAAIALIVEAGDAALAMPLSVMRAEVFGAIQACITQSLRRGEAPAWSAMAADDGYEQQTHQIRHTGDHLERVLFATFHVLASAGHSRAITVLLGLRPDIDLTPLAALFEDCRAEGGNVVAFPSPAAEGRVLAQITARPERCPELVSLLAEAKTACRRIARQGFRGADKDGATVVNGFADAVQALFAIRDQVERFCVQLSRAALPHGSWEHQHAADEKAFAVQFRTLYGENT